MDIEALNRAAFVAINASANTPAAWLVFGKAAAETSIFVLAGLLLVAWVRAGSGIRRALVHTAIAIPAALALNYVIGQCFPHPRPFMVGLGHTFLPHAAEPGFPSDHATVMWTIAFGLLLRPATRGFGLAAACLAILTSWGRVFLGLHFPLDVLGSAAVAAAVIAALAPLRSLVERNIAGPI